MHLCYLPHIWLSIQQDWWFVLYAGNRDWISAHCQLLETPVNFILRQTWCSMLSSKMRKGQTKVAFYLGLVWWASFSTKNVEGWFYSAVFTRKAVGNQVICYCLSRWWAGSLWWRSSYSISHQMELTSHLNAIFPFQDPTTINYGLAS